MKTPTNMTGTISYGDPMWLVVEPGTVSSKQRRMELNAVLGSRVMQTVGDSQGLCMNIRDPLFLEQKNWKLRKWSHDQLAEVGGRKPHGEHLVDGEGEILPDAIKGLEMLEMMEEEEEEGGTRTKGGGGPEEAAFDRKSRRKKRKKKKKKRPSTRTSQRGSESPTRRGGSKSPTRGGSPGRNTTTTSSIDIAGSIPGGSSPTTTMRASRIKGTAEKNEIRKAMAVPAYVPVDGNNLQMPTNVYYTRNNMAIFTGALIAGRPPTEYEKEQKEVSTDCCWIESDEFCFCLFINCFLSATKCKSIVRVC